MIPAAFRSVWWTAFLQLFWSSWSNDVWMRQWVVDSIAAGKSVAPFCQGTVWESYSGQGRCTGCKNKPFIGMRICTTILLLHSFCCLYMSEWAKAPSLLLLPWTVSNTLLQMSPNPSLASINLQSENKHRYSVLVWFAFHFVQIFGPFVFCFILVLIFIWFSHCQSLQFSERCLLF